MKPRLLLTLFTFIGTLQTALAQHPNVLIGTDKSPNEPAICINPKNPQQVVAGANIDNVYYSSDGGASWKTAPVECPWGIWGDPVIGVDNSGAFYFLHLSNPPAPGNWIDRIIAQKSTDGGQNWSAGSFMGLNGNKVQDKHWIATNMKTNELYVTWTQFDVYGSTAPTDSSVILFSKSSNGGQSWSAAKRISQLAGNCVDNSQTAEGAVPAVGPNGELYVAWSLNEKIWFDRSLDGGNTWLNNDILVGTQPGGWDFAIPGIYRANGMPITTCDTSGGPYHGTLYINWGDQRNGSDDTDIWLSKSTDGGNTWSPPARVNNDAAGHQQFFSWMTVDQKTGWLWFVFYDRRKYNDQQTDVYMAVSKDGGLTFHNFKVSQSPFTPDDAFFFGDYTNIAAHNNVVRPIWTRLEGGDLSVWTALVNPDILVSDSEPETLSDFIVDNPYPNPAAGVSGFSFKLHVRAQINLQIIDLQGQTRATLIRQEWRNPGKYMEKIDAGKLGIPAGDYFMVLEVDGQKTTRKLVFVK